MKKLKYIVLDDELTNEEDREYIRYNNVLFLSPKLTRLQILNIIEKVIKNRRKTTG